MLFGGKPFWVRLSLRAPFTWHLILLTFYESQIDLGVFDRFSYVSLR